jgi:CBS domain-containing protein
MVRDVLSLSPEDTIGDASNVLKSQGQRDFPVVEDGKTVGVLTYQELLSALAEGSEEVQVAEVMNATTSFTSPMEMLDIAISKMLDCDSSGLPVVQEEQLIGLLTQEGIGEFVAKKTAVESTRT